jgi:hypothetical protein
MCGISSARSTYIVIEPCNVNFKAFERRFSTTYLSLLASLSISIGTRLEIIFRTYKPFYFA